MYDIATFLPNTLYTYFGNEEEMEYCYPLMKDWVDFIDRGDAARGRTQISFDFMDTFGDWLALMDRHRPVSKEVQMIHLFLQYIIIVPARLYAVRWQKF